MKQIIEFELTAREIKREKTLRGGGSVRNGGTHQVVKILRNCARAKERKADMRGRLEGREEEAEEVVDACVLAATSAMVITSSMYQTQQHLHLTNVTFTLTRTPPPPRASLLFPHSIQTTSLLKLLFYLFICPTATHSMSH